MKRFKNIETFERALKRNKNIIDETYIKVDNIIYKSLCIGGYKENCYIIFENINSSITISYTLNKIDDNTYKGYNKITDVTLGR